MELVVHHSDISAYDNTAMKTISSYMRGLTKKSRTKLIKYIRKTNQSITEYNAIFLVLPDDEDIKFRQTVEEAYQDALNEDIEYPDYIRWWVKDGKLNLVARVQSHIFADIDYRELHDEKGRLQQFVKDAAIEEVKRALLCYQ